MGDHRADDGTKVTLVTTADEAIAAAS